MLCLPREKIDKINISISLDDFLNCLKQLYKFRYSRIMHPVQFSELERRISLGAYTMQKIENLVNLAFPFRREGTGFFSDDDILSFPMIPGDPTYREHYIVPISIEDRLVIDALSTVLLKKAGKFLPPKVFLYGKTLMSGDSTPGVWEEFNSWDNVHSVVVFDIHEALSHVDVHLLLETLKKSIKADPIVWQCFDTYFCVAQELQLYMANIFLDEYDTPYCGLPLMGSLPLVFLSIFSNLDIHAQRFIGDWPYARLNFEFIFPVFGENPIDEEPYLQLYDFFLAHRLSVRWDWLYNNSGLVLPLRTGFLHLTMGRVLFSQF